MTSVTETKSYVTNSKLQIVQSISGCAFASFLSIHIANNAFAILGPLAYDEVQKQLQKIYQNRYVEVVILGSLGVHVVSSSILVLRRWRRKKDHQSSNVNTGKLKNIGDSNINVENDNEGSVKDSNEEKILKYENKNRKEMPWHRRFHRYTGYALVSATVGHILAVRIIPQYFSSSADFSYIQFSLEKFSIILYPYLFLFHSFATYHLMYGVLLSTELACSSTLLPNLRRASRRIRKSIWFHGSILAICSVGVFSTVAFGMYNVSKERYPEFNYWHERITPKFFHMFLSNEIVKNI